MSASTHGAHRLTTHAHTLRISVRVHVGAFHREVDLSLPATSAIAELLDEVLAFCEAPRISRPWRATTAAGMPLDMTLPLHRTPLEHGSVLVLTPAEPVDAPIIRDSAEALVTQTTGGGAHGALSAAAALGSVLLSVLLSGFIGWPPALLAGAAVALVTLSWQRKRMSLAPVAVSLSTAAAITFVTSSTSSTVPQTPAEWAWTVLAACGTALLVVAVTAALRAIPLRLLAAVITTALLAAASCLGFLLPATDQVSPFAPMGALALVLGIIVLALAPGLVAGLAGLRVPQLPTAGEDLSVADEVQPDVDARARRARLLADGVSAGAAAVLVVSVLLVGWLGGLGPQLLALSVAGATVLHSARHRSVVPAWSLALVALASLSAAVLAAYQSPSTTTLVIGALTVLALVTAVLWAGRVRAIEPTTTAWWERLEVAAIIASFPLAAWVGGLFALIRGLG